VDGYYTIAGSWHNPWTPGTPENVINAWKKRWAVMHETYKLKGGPDDPTLAVGDALRCWVGVQLSEYYLQTYGYLDTERLIQLGFWSYETEELSLAIDHFFERTNCGAWCDPELLYQDIDVTTDPTSWGRIKAHYRSPKSEPMQNGELPPDPMDLPGGTW
jgi:hypothetical protein